MNGLENLYVAGDFREEGSFLILDSPPSPPRSPVEVSTDPPPQVTDFVTPCRSTNTDDFKDASSNDFEMGVQSQLARDEGVSALEEPRGSVANNVDNPSLESRVSVVPKGQLETDMFSFSMTNYSLGSSSSSTDTQLEDLRKQMDEVLADNSGLRDLAAEEHEKLKKALEKFDEMKSSANTSLAENKSKCEESRRKIENLEQENILLKKQVEDWQVKVQENLIVSSPIPMAGESDFEKLESMESQLSSKDEAMKQIDKQLQDITEHLNSENNRLKEIIRQNDEVIRQKDEQFRQMEDHLNQHTEFLSKSDEALARTLSEKDDLESKVETFEKRVSQLEEERNTKEQEAATWKQQVDAAKQIIEQFRSEVEKLNSSLGIYRRDLEATQQRVIQLEEEKKLAEQEAATCRPQLDGANVVIQQLRYHNDELSSSLEESQQQMNVRLATLKAEHDKELDQFRYNLQKEISEKRRFEIERNALMAQLNEVNGLLSDKTEQLNLMINGSTLSVQNSPLANNSTPSGQTRNGATNSYVSNDQSNNATSITAIPGQVYGFLRREVMGIGTSPSSPPLSGFEFVGDAAAPQNPPPHGYPPIFRAPAPRDVEVGSCPICNKSFDSVQRLQRHAANCGIEMMAERTDPFVFP